MNKTGTLYVYELKKIVNRKIVWITGIIMLALCIFSGFSALVSTSVYYGETEVSGYEALKIIKHSAKSFSGRVIDDTLLQEMQEEYRTEETREVSNYSSTAPIRFYVQQIVNDRDLLSDINSDELYAIREKEIYQNNTDQMLTEEENAFWSNKDSQIQKPFVYEYTDGWSNLWTCAYTINWFFP